MVINLRVAYSVGKFLINWATSGFSRSNQLDGVSSLVRLPSIYIVMCMSDSIYWPLIHSRLVTALYRSLAHTDYCSKSTIVFTSRFLATDFNTGTITVLLYYTLQISHIKPSLHSRTFNWALVQLTGYPKPSRLQLSMDHIENVPLLLYHCSVRVCCCRNVFTEPLPINGSVYLLISRSLHSNGSTR
jgi:hypothetical protein